MMIKPFDAVIILLTAGIIAIYLLNTINMNNDNSFVKIEVEGETYIYPLDSNMTKVFKGAIGNTTVEISNGKAKIIQSDCKNKTCIKIGSIYKNGQSTACLPNRILVTIEGGNSDEVDVISY